MSALMSAPKGHTVYLALGTNMGDRLANLEQARLALEAQVHLRTCSPIYETPPWGYRACRGMGPAPFASRYPRALAGVSPPSVRFLPLSAPPSSMPKPSIRARRFHRVADDTWRAP